VKRAWIWAIAIAVAVLVLLYLLAGFEFIFPLKL
jgi:hypothetical protein